MILSDSKILEAIKWKHIVIDPFNQENLGPHSYDVHLSDKMMVYDQDVLDMKHQNSTIKFIIPETGYLIKPGRLYLGSTVEYTESTRYIPFLDGKSSIARLGINIHITAGRGDIGFKGHWTLEITCVQPVIIYPNVAIGQLIYMESKGNILNPYQQRKSSKYKGNNLSPKGSLMHEEFKN